MKTIILTPTLIFLLGNLFTAGDPLQSRLYKIENSLSILTISPPLNKPSITSDSLPVKIIENIPEKLSIKSFESESVQIEDWKYEPLPGHYLWHYNPTIPGDVNGDGYDDLVIHSEYQFKQYVSTYLGGAQGLKKNPDWQIVVGDTTMGYFEIITVSAAGDINDDGYQDIFVIGHYPDKRKTEKPLLLLGSSGGFSVNAIDLPADSDIYQAWVYPTKLGDVNGDGIDDVALFYDYPYFSGVMLYGSRNGTMTSSNWPSSVYTNEETDGSPPIAVGDFNGDGYNDILAGVYLFNGSATGISNTHNRVINLPYNWYAGPAIAGDFNGDGFSDLIIGDFDEIEQNLAKNIFYFIPGSPNSLDNSTSLIIKEWLSTGYSLPQYATMGDINNDGFDDFSLGHTIYFGGINTYDPNSFHPQRYIDFKSVEFKGNSPNFCLNYAGDIDRNGSADFYTGIEEIMMFYSPRFERPAVSCPDTVEFCYKGPNANYEVPLFEVSKSHFWGIGHNYSDSLERFITFIGSGVDASGPLINGQLIRWNALGYNNVNYGCITKVIIKNTPITPVTIKSNSAHPKGDPNTFYIGYGAEAFRIEALPAGGGGPYTYLWSNGSTEKNPRISESVPGEYPYWVKMKNVHGCEASDTAFIKVENALCSSPLVDVVMSQYPAILQNPLLANLIKSNSKIAVCKDGQTMCFTKAVVDVRITRAGYTIGACTPGVIPAEAFMTDEMEDILRGGLKVIVAPNPSSHAFQLNVVSIYNEPVMIRIMDLAGRQVELLNNVSSNQTLTVGHKLRAGTYIAEVISGKQRKVLKLVKMQ